MVIIFEGRYIHTRSLGSQGIGCLSKFGKQNSVGVLDPVRRVVPESLEDFLTSPVPGGPESLQLQRQIR